MNPSRPSGAHPSRARRRIAAALCLLLVYGLALNLLWEMWSETGTFGAAMNLSMWLFGVPGRWLVYMLLPWVHVIVAVVLCIALHRAIAGKGHAAATGTPAPAGVAPGAAASPFLAWGLLTIAVSCSFAGLQYLGQRQIELAHAGQPAQDIALADLGDGSRLDAPTRLRAEPLQDEILSALPLRRSSTAERTLYVPLSTSAGAAADVRAVLHLAKPLRQAVEREDWAPPYAVRRMFAPVPTWVRGEWARRGHRVDPDAVLVERIRIDADGRAWDDGLTARSEAIIIAAIGSFCGLLLIGLEWLLGRGASARTGP